MVAETVIAQLIRDCFILSRDRVARHDKQEAWHHVADRMHRALAIRTLFNGTMCVVLFIYFIMIIVHEAQSNIIQYYNYNVYSNVII